MSNYSHKARNPKTGKVEMAEFVDDFYSKYNYGVRFPDGTMYKDTKVVVMTGMCHTNGCEKDREGMDAYCRDCLNIKKAIKEGMEEMKGVMDSKESNNNPPETVKPQNNSGLVEFELDTSYLVEIIKALLAMQREKTVKEVIEYISNDLGWEQSRDFYLDKLLKNGN